MDIHFTERAQRQYNKLAPELKKKADKQLLLLRQNLKHPSLNVKKMGGSERYEARVGFHFRLSFLLEGNSIYILSIGTHDVGLGKK